MNSSDSTNRDPSAWDTGDDVPWTLLDRDELETAYWEVIAPVFEADGHDPETERPTHEWLSTNGFRGLVYALREYHDTTFGDFWDEIVGGTDEDPYDWGIEHEPTREQLEAFIDSRRERTELRESSVETLRYRLATYVRAYAAANDSADLVSPVAPDSDAPAHEASQGCWNAFDYLDDEYAATTVRRIHETADQWYQHLIRKQRAAINPAAGLEEEYSWGTADDAGDSDNPALGAEHVSRLMDAAESTVGRLLVVALCGWGLRPNEAAALHADQFALDPEDDAPYIAFEERKNRAGQVSLLYGEDVVRDRLAELSDREDWNGYLFPSRRSATGHRRRQWINERFDELTLQANLPAEIDGARPVPKMGRRFWYDAYTEAMEQVVDEVEAIAAEQGSADPLVVLQNYLSDERKRKLRREQMRDRLAEAFEPTDVN